MKAGDFGDRFPAAGYIRLSREDGDREESDSVMNQKKLIQSFLASREDLELEGFYVDDGFTGTNFERPGFQRMLRDIRGGKIRCVVVKDLSRFGRDYIEAGRYLERLFPEWGVRFISVIDQIDSIRKAYDLLLPIKNIFNEQYARDISEKIQATMRQKQRAGEFIGAFASYGYRKSPSDKNRLLIDPYAAGIVRRIFQMFLQGMGKQTIARTLNREGILCPAEYKAVSGQNYRNGNSPRGRAGWTYSTINSILHKEIYAGDMVQGTRHQQMRSRQKRVPRENWVVVRETHEPVIDRQTWEKTQRLLGKRTREPGDFRENVLAGFLRCGDCGGPMVRTGWKRKDGSRGYSYYCGTYKRKGGGFCSSHGISLDVIEGILRQDLGCMLKKLRVPESLQRRQAPGGNAAEGEKLRGELERLERLQQGVYEDYREGILNRREFERLRESYRQREELCRAGISALETETGKEEEGILERADRLQRGGPGILTRGMIGELVDRILVFENRGIRIVYRFSGECRDWFAPAYPPGQQRKSAADSRLMEAEIREK